MYCIPVEYYYHIIVLHIKNLDMNFLETIEEVIKSCWLDGKITFIGGDWIFTHIAQVSTSNFYLWIEKSADKVCFTIRRTDNYLLDFWTVDTQSVRDVVDSIMKWIDKLATGDFETGPTESSLPNDTEQVIMFDKSFPWVNEIFSKEFILKDGSLWRFHLKYYCLLSDHWMIKIYTEHGRRAVSFKKKDDAVVVSYSEIEVVDWNEIGVLPISQEVSYSEEFVRTISERIGLQK